MMLPDQSKLLGDLVEVQSFLSLVMVGSMTKPILLITLVFLQVGNFSWVLILNIVRNIHLIIYTFVVDLYRQSLYLQLLWYNMIDW